jgi:hypothetical protein
MPTLAPVMAAGPRDSEKRPRALSPACKQMIRLLVYGDPNDEDCKPLDFIEAGKLAGFKPDVARRWLDRADFRAALRGERRAFREAVCAGNEAALQRVRDESKNGMVVVHAVRTLEHLSDEATTRQPGAPMTPGFAIILTVAAPAGPAGESAVVDVTPRSPTIDHAARESRWPAAGTSEDD